MPISKWCAGPEEVEPLYRTGGRNWRDGGAETRGKEGGLPPDFPFLSLIFLLRPEGIFPLDSLRRSWFFMRYFVSRSTQASLSASLKLENKAADCRAVKTPSPAAQTPARAPQTPASVPSPRRHWLLTSEGTRPSFGGIFWPNLHAKPR